MSFHFDFRTFNTLLNLVAGNHTRAQLLHELSLLQIPGVTTEGQCEKYISLNSPASLCPVTFFDVCPKDCLLFWREYCSDTHCRKCNASRFDEKGNPTRVYPYLSLAFRLRRFYASKKWSQMFEDQSNRFSQDDIFSDVADGDLFKRITSEVNFSKYTPPFFFGVDGITMDAQQSLSVVLLLSLNLI